MLSPFWCVRRLVGSPGKPSELTGRAATWRAVAARRTIIMSGPNVILVEARVFDPSPQSFEEWLARNKERISRE
jgi:hypothetical protein